MKFGFPPTLTHLEMRLSSIIFVRVYNSTLAAEPPCCFQSHASI
jgi:hypothetical protein